VTATLATLLLKISMTVPVTVLLFDAELPAGPVLPSFPQPKTSKAIEISATLSSRYLDNLNISLHFIRLSSFLLFRKYSLFQRNQKQRQPPP
jgi:hypothetical protein